MNYNTHIADIYKLLLNRVFHLESLRAHMYVFYNTVVDIQCVTIF